MEKKEQISGQSNISLPEKNLPMMSGRISLPSGLGGSPNYLRGPLPTPSKGMFPKVFIFQQTSGPPQMRPQNELSGCRLLSVLHLAWGRLVFMSFLTFLHGPSHFYVPDWEHTILLETNSHLPEQCRLNPYLEWKKTKHLFKANINYRDLVSMHGSPFLFKTYTISYHRLWGYTLH